jgi:protein-glutamine gamma-glutamyltransferase
MGLSDADWRQMVTLLISAVGAIIIGLLLWSLKRMVRPDPVQQLWLAFCRKLAAAGLSREPHEGPRDFTRRAALRFPAAAAAIVSVGERYILLRYGADRPVAQIAELKRSIREFRPT